MASAVIHMVIANEINKELKMDNDLILVGSIAPDLAKQIGESKCIGHFMDDPNISIPNIDRFIKKYKDDLDDPFVMGYYIHLFTDFLWFKYFLTEIYDDNYINTLDGKKIKCSKDKVIYYIYHDYTNLNKELLAIYNLDMSIFDKKEFAFSKQISEISMDKLDIILEKTKYIISISKKSKEYLFNMNNINQFITTSIDFLKINLKELGYL